MNPSDKPAKPLQRFAIFELRRVAALSSEQGESKTIVEKKRLFVDLHRSDQRNLAVSQLQGKLMFFLNLFIAPPSRPVKLRHHRVGILYTDLVDTILITVQCQQTPISQHAGGIHRMQNGVRVQPVIGRLVILVSIHAGIIAVLEVEWAF